MSLGKVQERVRPFPQPTIGILGGSSNQATAEYYRLINDAFNAQLGGWDNCECIIVSVNFGNIEHFVRRGQWDETSRYLDEKISRLEKAGADVLISVSNTLHRVVAPLMKNRKMDFIHIADPTGAAMRAAGITCAGLLGTYATMISTELCERFKDQYGVDIIVPSEQDKVEVDRIIFDELCRRDLRDSSRTEYLRIVDDMRSRGAQGVILGCTEIFLLIDQQHLPDYPVFNTTELHVMAVRDYALSMGNGRAG